MKPLKPILDREEIHLCGTFRTTYPLRRPLDYLPIMGLDCTWIPSTPSLDPTHLKEYPQSYHIKSWFV
jgi:hypothetical protein